MNGAGQAGKRAPGYRNGSCGHPHWVLGYGSFGGNRLLMTILQIVAAAMAGLAALVYFTADAAGQNDFQTAVQLLRELVVPEDAVPLAEVTEAVECLGLPGGAQATVTVLETF